MENQQFECCRALKVHGIVVHLGYHGILFGSAPLSNGNLLATKHGHKPSMPLAVATAVQVFELWCVTIL